MSNLPHHLPLLAELADPLVRDLAWAIGSPGLLDQHDPAFSGKLVSDAFCAQVLHEGEGWLRRLDADPQPLHAFIQQRPTKRLGRYFESLIQFWLRSLPHVSELRAGVQVCRENRVIGEYDLLFTNGDWGGSFHWELVVKFYLQRGQDGLDNFVGPALQDRLDRKVNKLFHQQLRLGQTPEGRMAMGDRAVSRTAQVFFKGYLFYPLASWGDVPMRQGVSPRHLKGWWMRHGAEALPEGDAAGHWLVLERMRWLSPAKVSGAQSGAVATPSEMTDWLSAHFDRGGAPVLLAQLAPDSMGCYNEVTRGFVVPEHWPERGDDPPVVALIP